MTCTPHSNAHVASATAREGERPVGIIVVDDHPAVRAGLRELFEDDGGIAVLATAATARDGLAAITSATPAVAVVDWDLPDEDGLELCLRTRSLPQPPRVLVCSAFAGDALAVRAIVAGAHGIASKAARGDVLCALVRALARGASAFPPLAPAALERAGARLDPDDLPILGMLAHRTPPGEIAEALGVDPDWVTARRWAILDRLRVVAPRRAGADPEQDWESACRP